MAKPERELLPIMGVKTEEAAVVLGVSKDFVRDCVNAGLLPRREIGTKFLFYIDELRAFMEKTKDKKIDPKDPDGNYLKDITVC